MFDTWRVNRFRLKVVDGIIHLFKLFFIFLRLRFLMLSCVGGTLLGCVCNSLKPLVIIKVSFIFAWPTLSPVLLASLPLKVGVISGGLIGKPRNLPWFRLSSFKTQEL